MTYNTFYLDALISPTDCPDITRLCNLGGIEKELRVIRTPSVYGIVIDGVYLSLAAGGNTFARGDYILIQNADGRYRIGVNENLYN